MSTDRDVRDLFADCLRKLYVASGCIIPEEFDPGVEAARIEEGILYKESRTSNKAVVNNARLSNQYQFVELALRTLPFLDEAGRAKESNLLLTEYIYPILKETK